LYQILVIPWRRRREAGVNPRRGSGTAGRLNKAWGSWSRNNILRTSVGDVYARKKSTENAFVSARLRLLDVGHRVPTEKRLSELRSLPGGTLRVFTAPLRIQDCHLLSAARSCLTLLRSKVRKEQRFALSEVGLLPVRLQTCHVVVGAKAGIGGLQLPKVVCPVSTVCRDTGCNSSLLVGSGLCSRLRRRALQIRLLRGLLESHSTFCVGHLFGNDAAKTLAECRFSCRVGRHQTKEIGSGLERVSCQSGLKSGLPLNFSELLGKSICAGKKEILNSLGLGSRGALRAGTKRLNVLNRILVTGNDRLVCVLRGTVKLGHKESKLGLFLICFGKLVLVSKLVAAALVFPFKTLTSGSGFLPRLIEKLLPR
jgi:hypothetical protein